MDGLEWRRSKWSLPVKGWFWINERLGCWFGSHLIADHPAIARHLATRVSAAKITCIPYGADADDDDRGLHITDYGLSSEGYALVVARPEPENQVLEIIRAYSESRRPFALAVVGPNDAEVPYQKAMLDAAGPGVRFLGAIYDGDVLRLLRRHCLFHVHGHQVGGTNPSLVEALAAGSPVLAHDNEFNRWVAGPEMAYFKDEEACVHAFDAAGEGKVDFARLSAAAMERHRAMFTWEPVLSAYARLLEAALDGRPVDVGARGEADRWAWDGTADSADEGAGLPGFVAAPLLQDGAVRMPRPRLPLGDR